ncbi:MAG: hypothetical protein WBC78_26075 [Candidatus Sulfotelmatobacter sp.]
MEAEGAKRDERVAALEKAGYTVILTHDVREALRIFISRELDAVLLEQRLGNGKKNSLRAEMNSIRPGVPIVALCPADSRSSRTPRFFDHAVRDGKGYDALIAVLRDLLDGDDA